MIIWVDKTKMILDDLYIFASYVFSFQIFPVYRSQDWYSFIENTKLFLFIYQDCSNLQSWYIHFKIQNKKRK